MHFRGLIYLQYEEACVEHARIDKDRTKLSTLKQLVRFLKEEVVSIQHDHPFILHQAPRVEFVQ